MVSNFLVCRLEDGFLLRMNRALIEPTITFLSKYIVFSKATTADESENYQCLGLLCNEANVPQEIYEMSDSDEGILIKVSGNSRFELWTQKQTEPSVDELSDWLSAEIQEGIVWVDEHSTEEFIPQMFNLQALKGISFEKGCYLGQEIVARMQFRGELKNRLHIGQSEAPLTVGTKVLNASEKTAGTVVATSGKDFAAVLRIAEPSYQLEDGTSLSATELA